VYMVVQVQGSCRSKGNNSNDQTRALFNGVKGRTDCRYIGSRSACSCITTARALCIALAAGSTNDVQKTAVKFRTLNTGRRCDDSMYDESCSQECLNAVPVHL
jgi:hypothetical protein